MSVANLVILKAKDPSSLKPTIGTRIQVRVPLGIGAISACDTPALTASRSSHCAFARSSKIHKDIGSRGLRLLTQVAHQCLDGRLLDDIGLGQGAALQGRQLRMSRLPKRHWLKGRAERGGIRRHGQRRPRQWDWSFPLRAEAFVEFSKQPHAFGAVDLPTLMHRPVWRPGSMQGQVAEGCCSRGGCHQCGSVCLTAVVQPVVPQPREQPLVVRCQGGRSQLRLFQNGRVQGALDRLQAEQRL